MRTDRIAFFVAVLAASCATLHPLPELHSSSGDATALQTAAERFYSAATPAEMIQAVEQARAAGPDSVIFHELAMELAVLQDQDAEAYAHAKALVLDQADDDARLHLQQYSDIWTTHDEHPVLARVYEQLAKSSADPHLRTLAGSKWGAEARLRGDIAAASEALALKGWMPRMTIIGTWDNDQGKGFDTVLPPEKSISLEGRYPGSVVEVGWRPDPPHDERGGIPLGELMSPNRWAVAYAASAFKAPGGNYTLWLTTSDPIKVWVNDELVFQYSLPLRSHFDQIQLPVTLRAGVNRLLIKSAHRDGNEWRLEARVAMPDGATAIGLEEMRADVPAAEGAPPGSPPDFPGQVATFGPAGSEARRLAHRARWARFIAGHTLAIAAAEGYAKERPSSLFAKKSLAYALWDNGDRGRASDLLSALDRDGGDAFDELREMQARYWVQQGMMQQGRQALVALTAKHPHAARAWRELEELFTKEGWTEERCDALKSEEAAYPAWLRLQGAMARCEQALGFSRKAEERYLDVLSEVPYDGEYINALLALVEQRRDYAAAAALVESRLKVYPFESTTWERLAEIRRKAGDPDGTREALERAIALDPDSPNAHAELAHLAMQRGDRTSAVGEFREALTRNPANESVANRLDFLAPAAKEVWEADVPSEAELDAAVQSRRKLKAEPGANLAYLIDAEVTELKPDGSTSGVVTHVIHAFNQQGRDGLLRQHLQPGRTRILHAYAVDPAGQRVEPSSIRGAEVYFRGLEVGSTVVLQYRRDVPPSAYLAKHLAEEWWFQSANAQSPHSQLVLWRPSSQRLHETLFGPVKREEKTVGDRTRVSWTYDAAPAVTMEPSGPSAREVLANLRISTVPDWDVFLSWEDALLQDAFRPSPELDAVAKRILEGATTPGEKLARIHEYLMEEIRYQQDYENPIAGVRPHPASTVLERRYGDCKDKAVTFMTLARAAGLKAEYALVRTRQLGQVDIDVPMQQFNHAIVYVPPQPGLSAGRFFDATADALDVDAVPISDVGTQSLVYDPLTHQHAWKAIDYQPPEENSYQLDTVLTLKADGSATGESTITGQGAMGSWLRVSSRNAQQFKQVLQQTFNAAFPGARVGDDEVADAKDVLHPLKIKVRFEVPGAARLEDGKLRMRLVPDWNPQTMFGLEHRTMALVYGAPYQVRTNVDVHLPQGARVASTPSSGPADIDCLKVDRRIEAAGGVVKASQSVRVTCERTEVKDYPAAREKSDSFRKRLDEELVVELKPVKGASKPRAER